MINTSTPLAEENQSKSSDLGQTHEGASQAETHHDETVLMDADLSSVLEEQVTPKQVATQASGENDDWIENLEKKKKAKGTAAKHDKNLTRAKATAKKAPRKKAPAKSMPKYVESNKSKSWNVGKARPGIDFPDDSDDDDDSDFEWKAFKERQKLREEKRKMLSESKSKGKAAKEVIFQHHYRDSSSSTFIDAIVP